MIVMVDGEEYLTADEACSFLEVKPGTLYAYVSRGLLRSYPQELKRGRLYSKSEVSRMRLFAPAVRAARTVTYPCRLPKAGFRTRRSPELAGSPSARSPKSS